MYLEYDGRDVPDVATVVADYNEGCQVIITATMCNDTQLGRGDPRPRWRRSSSSAGGDYIKGFEVYGQDIAGGPSQAEGRRFGTPVHTYESPSRQVKRRATPPTRCGRTSWSASGPEPRDAQHAGTGGGRVHDGGMGVQSYRRARCCSGTRRSASPSRPTPSGPTQLGEAAARSAASRTRSSAGTAATPAALLTPPAYQKLEGPWVDGKDRHRNMTGWQGEGVTG